MVGKRALGDPKPRFVAAQREISTDGLGERIAALPGFAAVRDAADARRASTRTWSAARCATRCSAARRANLDLVVDGDPGAADRGARRRGRRLRPLRDRDGRRSPAGRSTSPARGPRPTRSPGALPEVQPGDAGRGPRRAATSPSTRWRCRSPSPDELIDLHGGLEDLRRGPAAGPARGLVRRRPDQGAARGPLRGPARARARAADAGAAARRPTSTRSRATASRPSSAGSRPSPRARRGFELLAGWGLIELAPAAGELIERVGGAARAAAVVGARSRAPGGAARRRPRRRRPAVARARRRSTRRSPSAAVAAARGRSGVELVLARALGGEWLDRYVDEWRDVRARDLRRGPDRRRGRRGPGGRPRARPRRCGRSSTARRRRRDDELRIALDRGPAS